MEDAVLDGHSLDFFDYFFDTKGSSNLMFYYQEVDIPTPEGGKTPDISNISFTLITVSRVKSRGNVKEFQ